MTRRRTTRRLRGDRGIVTVGVVLGVGVLMLFMVQFVNLCVFQYGESAVRAALDEGARAGTRGGGVAACEQRANEALSQLALGMADGVTITCSDSGRSIVATATANWQGWVSGLGDYDKTATATAAKEDR